jgi:hypothetical protein
MADDIANDVSTEITLDDFNADEQQPAKAEPSPAAKDEPKAPEDKAEAKETKADDGDDTPAVPDVPLKTDTEDQPVDETETENKPPGVPEEAKTPKAVNRWQQLSNENKELREQVEKLTSETYAPQSVQELTEIVNPDTGQVYTVAEATDIALNQQLQMRDYNTRATNAQALLGAEAYEVMQELPIFNRNSDQYDEELSALAAATMEANLVRDPNIPEIGPDGQPTGKGMIVDYHQTPKQIYQTIARASGISATRGEIRGQANTEKQLANVDAPSNTAPQKAKSDPLMELWESDD